MIEILFIIDFFEKFLVKRPEKSEEKFSKIMLEIKSLTLKNCKQPNVRFKEYVNFGNKIYKLLATTTDENIIIGVLVNGDNKKERDIWGLIEKIFESKLLKSYKKEEEQQNFNLKHEMLEEIDFLIEECKNKFDKNELSNVIEDNIKTVEKLNEKSISNTMKMTEILINTEIANEESKKFNSQASDLKISVHWYQKKEFFLFIGIVFLSIIFSVIFVAKFMLE